MAPGTAAVVTNGRLLMVHNPATGFHDALTAGDFALLDSRAQSSQHAVEVGF